MTTRCTAALAPRRAWLCSAAGLAASAAAPAWAQQAAAKPIRMVVPFATGGGSDLVARLVAPRLQEILGQPVLIDNKGGAGGLLGMEIVAKAPADGLTILLMSDGFPALAATHKPAFDPMNSLVPVAQLCIAPFGLMVHPSVPVNSTAEFVKLVRAQPGKLSYGSSGSGGLTHLITESFKQKAGLRMVHIPYRSTGAALPDLLSGTVQVYLGSVPPLMQQVNTGKLKLLAVTNQARWPLLPNVPTLGETVPGFSADPWFGVFVPRGTPAAVIERLSQALASVRGSEAFKAGLADQGMLPQGGSPAAFTQIVREDHARWARLVQAIGFKPE